MTQDNIIIDRSERNMEIPSTPSAVVLGRHEMLSRMLNAYLRETGQHDPFVQHATRLIFQLLLCCHVRVKQYTEACFIVRLLAIMFMEIHYTHQKLY